MNNCWRIRVAAVLVWAITGAAHASLFSDDEARQAIIDLRSKVNQNEEQALARKTEMLGELQQLQKQLEQVRSSLLELNNQLEALRADMAKMRGVDEQRARELSELQRRQRDIVGSVEERLHKIEPQKVVLDGKEFLADPVETKAFQDALAQLRSGDFANAGGSFAAFLRRFPASGYFEAARFWLGNAQYARRDYKEAMATFRSFLAETPEHPRAAEAMLALANCQIEVKDNKAARGTLSDLLKTYPKSEAAQAAKERLAAIK